MAKTYTSEELHKCDKETLSAIILFMQDQIVTLNRRCLPNANLPYQLGIHSE